MSIIRKMLVFSGVKGEESLYAAFDTYATISCINPSFLHKLGESTMLGRVRIIDMPSEDRFIEVKDAVILDFKVNDVTLSDEFFVVPDLAEEVVIGATTLRKWRIKLNFEEDKIEVDPKVAKLQLI